MPIASACACAVQHDLGCVRSALRTWQGTGTVRVFCLEKCGVTLG